MASHILFENLQFSSETATFSTDIAVFAKIANNFFHATVRNLQRLGHFFYCYSFITPHQIFHLFRITFLTCFLTFRIWYGSRS